MDGPKGGLEEKPGKRSKNDEEYLNMFAGLFNLAVNGLAKWHRVEKPGDRSHFALMMRTTDWCRKHGIGYKIHAPVNKPPKWLGKYGREKKREMLLAYMEELAGKFKDRVAIWEPINEPISYTGSKWWLSFMGERGFLSIHQIVRKKAPRAPISINEATMLLSRPHHARRFAGLLKKQIALGVPFDVIGIQAYDGLERKKVRRALDVLGQLGKELHITEFALNHPQPKGMRTPKEQADVWRMFYTTCFSHPKVTGITAWGLVEGNNGRHTRGSGLVSPDLTPKPAYHVYKDIVFNQWRTGLQGKTDAAGRISFRGFHGSYEVTAGGTTFEVHVKSGGKNEFVLKPARTP